MAIYHVKSQKNVSWLDKLQARWGVTSVGQVLMILLTFSLAGSSVVMLRKTFFALIGFDATTDIWVKSIVYILFVFPAYQLLLIGYGILLGQFRFFWEKEKKMALAIARIFRRRS